VRGPQLALLNTNTRVTPSALAWKLAGTD
jgi:hypothetical protein